MLENRHAGVREIMVYTAYQPVCPYCNRGAELVDGIEIYGARDKGFGMFWLCRLCDAYVGTHKNSKNHAPLGRLADRELRKWKQVAHEMFDTLWKSERMTRTDAYAYMARKMGITKEEAHIGRFDLEQCKKLVALLRQGKE
jgi:zinc-finger-containing domain